MTELERVSWEAVHAAEAGDLDRLAAALEARQEAIQRAGLPATGLADDRTTLVPASDRETQRPAQEPTGPFGEKRRELHETELAEAGETVTLEVFALGEQALAQLREIAAGMRHQRARLETIQSGFALNAALEPRLDFRG